MSENEVIDVVSESTPPVNKPGNTVTVKHSRSVGSKTKTVDHVVPPRVTNKGCSKCKLEKIVNETIKCYLCNNLFHALCRSGRGYQSEESVCPKSFYDQFQQISSHSNKHNKRWGFISFVCHGCSSESQSVTPAALTDNETQTLISGNLEENVQCDDPDSLTNRVTPSESSTDIKESLLLSMLELKSKNDNLVSCIESLELKSNKFEAEMIKQLHSLSEKLVDTREAVTPLIDSDKLITTISEQLKTINSSDHSNLRIPCNDLNDSNKLCSLYTHYLPNFVTESDKSSLSSLLDNVADNFKCIKSRNSTSSRDVLYFGDFTYKYGATIHQPRETPDAIKSVIEAITEKFPDANINSCLATRYSTGSNSRPSHQDNEPFIDPNSDIFTVSLGCKRQMKFATVNTSSSVSLDLEDCSLLMFSRSSQESWAHEISQDDSTTCRYSLTFRTLAPFFANSTAIIGDSNTEKLNFGSGPMHFGRWMPGERIPAGRIHKIPNPSEIKPYRNIVIHCGINDLREFNHKPIPVLANALEDKCIAFNVAYPRMKIHLSLLLPTKDSNLNRMANELNSYIIEISQKYRNISVISHTNLMDDYGNLDVSYARRFSRGGKPIVDAVHLGSVGIKLFCKNIKNCIVKRNNPKSDSNHPLGQLTASTSLPKPKSREANVYHSPTESDYPYFFPAPSYTSPSRPLLPQSPWNSHFDGDYQRGLVRPSFQLTNISQSFDGYQH